MSAEPDVGSRGDRASWASSRALFGYATLAGAAALGFAAQQASAYDVVHWKSALISLGLFLISASLVVAGAIVRAAELRSDRRVAGVRGDDLAA
jgi:hypothetical protein